MMCGSPKRMQTPVGPNGAGVGVTDSDMQTCVGVTGSGALQLCSFVLFINFQLLSFILGFILMFHFCFVNFKYPLFFVFTTCSKLWW